MSAPGRPGPPEGAGDPHEVAPSGRSATASVSPSASVSTPVPLYFSLVSRLSLVVGAMVMLAVGVAVALARLLPEAPWEVAALSLLVVLPLSVMLVRQQLQPVLSLFRALTGTVTTYRDGDYSFGLHQVTTRWATCCVSSGWIWCSASCFKTRCCKTRRWRCCWCVTVARWCTPTLRPGNC